MWSWKVERQVTDTHLLHVPKEEEIIVVGWTCIQIKSRWHRQKIHCFYLFLSQKKTKNKKQWCHLLVKNGRLTNLEIGHVVLQQSLSVADVLLGSHKYKGNHALKQQQRGGGIKSWRKQIIITLNNEQLKSNYILKLHTQQEHTNPSDNRWLTSPV